MAKIDQAARTAELGVRRSLYERGCNDHEIARRTGAKRNTVTVWRRGQGLPRQNGPHCFPRLTPPQRAARMLLYQLGWSDQHIAREQGVEKVTIRLWRVDLGMPANFPTGVTQTRNPRPGHADLFQRVRKAVGHRLPRDIADEAVSSLIVEILDGTIPIDRIEAVARKYGNKALEQFANKFGPRSLDEELGDGDGFRMIDMIQDESSSSWLEEMGATVW